MEVILVPEDIQPQAIILIKNISNIISTELNNNLKPYNITGVQARVLFYINCNSNKKNVFQKDIQKHFTNSEDSRYKCHVLTDKGRDVIESLSHVATSIVEKRILNGFSKDEIKTLTSLLLRVLSNLEK